MTEIEMARRVCFGWIKSNWDTYEDWLQSENLGVGLWGTEITDIAFALREYAAQSVALAQEANGES